MLRWGLGNHGGYQDRYGAEFADIGGVSGSAAAPLRSSLRLRCEPAYHRARKIYQSSRCGRWCGIGCRALAPGGAAAVRWNPRR
jgi:hypothetical protein